MPIAATCNHCGKAYKVSSKFAGKKAKCTDCGNSFPIPAAPAPAAPAPPAFENDLMADLSSAAALETASSAAPPAPPKVSASKCPSCNQLMDLTAVVCINCGFNRKTNKTMKVQVEKEKPVAEKPAKKSAPSFGGGSSKGAFSSLVIGALACVYGVYEYFDLKAMEDEHGSRQVHSIVKVAYEAGGRGLVLGVMLGIGGLFLLLGMYKLTRD